METATPGLPLGELLCKLLDESRSDWLHQHKAGRDEETAWTLDIVETHLAFQLKHGGRGQVQVTIIARSPWKHVTNVFNLRQRGPREWLIVSGSLNL